MTLGWVGIVRLGLVQAALGAVVMLATSVLNRIMVVEYALPAAIPAGLVAWHYAVQLSRPKWGHGSDRGGQRTPWIVGGMGLLALGAVLATNATLFAARGPGWALAAGLVAYSMIGAGVGAAGTSLLALLAARTAPARRPAAAAIAWCMMVAGIVVAAAVTGRLLDPYSPERLAAVAGGVALAAFLLALAAVWGVERGPSPINREGAPAGFRAALAEAWSDPLARRFALFVALSMLAYAMQDLILEPFAGLVFGMSPGESTRLAGTQHGGVLAGMVLVGVVGAPLRRRFGAGLKPVVVGGCVGSAMALALIAVAATTPGWPLRANVFALGLFNGVFAVAAIGAMMDHAGADGPGREGTRMGLWGAAQAVAFGAGGLLGAVLVDLGRAAGDTPAAFAAVFTLEAALFLGAAMLAARLGEPARQLTPARA